MCSSIKVPSTFWIVAVIGLYLSVFYDPEEDNHVMDAETSGIDSKVRIGFQ